MQTIFACCHWRICASFRTMLQVRSLYIYPVKSCAAVTVSALELDAKGPQFDRRWMVVDSAGRFVSQRELPRLALLQPVQRPDGGWILRAPSGAQIELGVSGAQREVQIWTDQVWAQDLGDLAHQWLIREVEFDGRLVYMGDTELRAIPEKYHSEFATLSFVDGMPLLLASEESLAELNSRLAQPIEMSRFRPNIVIAGGHPYEEDLWKQIRIGELNLNVAKSCSRCVITTIDQGTGESKGPEPLKTLAKYRRENSKVLFGRYLIHASPGCIEVGMPVGILPELQSSVLSQLFVTI